MTQSIREAGPFSIPRSIWGIGCVTLLMNMSTIIIFSLSPIYMTTVLGVTSFGVGIFEGAVEFISWITRSFSGVISDHMRKRKPLLLIAYSLAAISRPIFAVASNVFWLFVSRSIDRVGNGIQAPPREALVGDIAPKKLKGASYGLRQTLAMLGSFLGAVLVVIWFNERGEDFKSIFWFASVTPVLAVLTLLFMVKDSPLAKMKEKKSNFVESIKHIKNLKVDYWLVVFVAGVFMFSNYSGAFLILQAKAKVESITIAPVVMIFQNFAAMIAAYPIGRLSDKIDRRKLLAIGFLITIFSNTCLAYASGFFLIAAGATLWGAQLGITQSLLVAKVADTTSKEIRGTAFGLYYGAMGAMVFMGNATMGKVSEILSSEIAFHVSSFAAAVALFCLPLIKPSQKGIQL